MRPLLTAAIAATFALASCNMNIIKGDGHVVSKQYSQKGFKDIDASSALNVHLKQSPDYSIRIDAEENLLKLLKVYTEKDRLVIGFRDKVNVSPTRPIEVYISSPEFRNLEGSGACNINTEGGIKGNEVKLSLSGASNADLDLEANKLSVDASGATDIRLKGKVVYFSIDGSGNTTVHAFPLMADNTSVEISGAGDAEVCAAQSLKVDISGAGDVKYKGNPASIKKDVSGAGNITQVQ